MSVRGEPIGYLSHLKYNYLVPFIKNFLKLMGGELQFLNFMAKK